MPFALVLLLMATPPSVAPLPVKASAELNARLIEALQRAGFSIVDIAMSQTVLAATVSTTAEGRVQLAVAVTDSKTATVLVTRRLDAASEAGLLDGLSRLASELAAELTHAPMPEAPSRVRLWLPLFLGGVGGVALSTIFFTQAGGLTRRLEDPSALTDTQIRELTASRQGLQIGGGIAAGLGLACIVGGLVALVLPEPYRLSVAIVPTQSGGLFAFGWTL